MKPSGPKIAILGAGPIGLEAALYAAHLGLPYTVYDLGSIGEFVGRWGFSKMYTPFRHNRTELGFRWLQKHLPHHTLPAETDYLTGAEYREQYLLPLAQSLGVEDHFKLQTTVLSVGRNSDRKVHATGRTTPFRLLLRANQVERIATADVILDCTGTFARPNWLGAAGIPAVGELASRQHISYWPEDVLGSKKSQYQGKSILLVGHGLTAATMVCQLMDLAEENPATWVTWLANSNQSQPIRRLPNDPFRERDRLAMRANALATRCDGNLEFHAGVSIEEVNVPGSDKEVSVTVRQGGSLQTFKAEKLIALVGYKPDANMTAELPVNEPGYYVLGQKQHGRQPGFVIADGHRQVRKAFAEIVGQHKLNLHAA